MQGQPIQLATEPLEPRALLAVTVTFDNGELQLAYGAAGDLASISNDGTNISVSYTGDGGTPYTIAAAQVNGITVNDAGSSKSQSLTFAAGTKISLSAGLSSTGVENVYFNNPIDASGGSSSIAVNAPTSIVVLANLTGGNGGVSLIANSAGTATGNNTGITVGNAATNPDVTIATKSNGSISLLGRGAGNGVGVYLAGGTTAGGAGITANGSGTVTITGIGGNGSDYLTQGILSQGSRGGAGGTTISSGTGAISITGDASASTNTDFTSGVDLGLDTTITTGGNVAITAIGTTVAAAFYTEADITAGTGKTVTVRADSVFFGAGGGGSVKAASGTVAFETRSAGTQIDLGGADVLSGSLTLGLTDAEIDKVTAGTLVIGKSDSGAITVSAAISPPNATNLTLTTGSTIAINGGLSVGGSGNLALRSNGAITQTAAVSVGGTTTIAAGAGNAITLGQSGNNFNTLTVTSGGSVTVAEADGFTIAGISGIGSGDITVKGSGTVAATGAITTTGAILLQGLAAAKTIGVAGASGDVSFAASVFTNLTDGASGVTIGDTAQTGGIVVNAVTFADPATIRATGTGGSITVNGVIIGTGNASVTLSASPTTITLNNDITTANQPIILDNGSGGTTAVLLGNDVTLSAGSGAITINGTINNAYALTLNSTGTTTLGGAIGVNEALKSLTTDVGGTTIVASSAITTVNGQVFKDAYILKADTTLTSNNNGRIAFLSTVDSYDANYRALTVNTGGSTEFGDGGADYVGNTYRLLSLTTDAGGSTQVWISPSSDATPSIRTQNDQVYGDAAKLRADTTLTSNNNGTIAFNSTLDGAQTLNLTAGTGNVTFGGAVGGTNRLGAISIASATNVTAAAITAASLNQAAGSGTTTLNGAVNTNTAAGVSLTGTHLSVNARITTTNNGAVTFNESGTITIAAAGDILADGAVSITATGGITTAGDATTTNDDVTFVSKTTLSGPVVVSTGAGSGDIKFQSTLDGAQTLNLAAGTGNVTFGGAVGGTNRLGGISLSSAASVTAASTIKLDGTPGLATNGIAIAAGVSNITFAQSGSDIRGFSGSGVLFQGNSANSRLSGFTIAANKSNGVRFAIGDYTGTLLSSNEIRDNGDTTTHVGNGILVEGSNLMIGWTADASKANTVANTITGNALNGIEIRGAGAVNNTILSNSIYLNGYVDSTVPGTKKVVGEGIALTSTGNAGQAAPEILDVVKDNAANMVRVQFRVPATGAYYVQFFDNTPTDERAIFPADRNGFEGRTYVGDSPVQAGSAVATGKPAIAGTLVSGNILATVAIPAARFTAGDWLTASATAVGGTTPTNTSPFSSAVQVTSAPTLAVGGDGDASQWATEYSYTASGPASVVVNGIVGKSGALASSQIGILASLTGRPVVLAAAGNGQPITATVRSATRAGSAVRLTLAASASLVGTSGTFVLGSASLPAARLYDVSAATPAITTNTDGPIIQTALMAAGVSKDQAAAFVTRFQGGIRTATADFDGDGYGDLVTVAGGIQATLAPNYAAIFGNAPRIVTVYNGNSSGGWISASIDVSATFPNYTGGFLVTIGDVKTETSGSGNVTAELIVASTTMPGGNKVAIYDVKTAARGQKPAIAATPSQVINVSATNVTGLVAAPFARGSERADIVLATTTATQQTYANAYWTLNTTSLSIYREASSFASPATFFINSLVERQQLARPPAPTVLQNVFFFGAGLGAGDVDNVADQIPDLVLGAGSQGLGNFRVLSGAIMANPSQAAIDTALTNGYGFTQVSRSITPSNKWQPTGGPDYFVGAPLAGGYQVPPALAAGANAPLSVTVVNRGGNNFRAEIFAAIGATNQLPSNEVRSLSWAPSTSPIAFTVAAGSVQLKLIGDQRSKLAINDTVWIEPTAPAGGTRVARYVTAVTLLGGDTFVTIASPIDATTTAGNYYPNVWRGATAFSVATDPSGVAAPKTRFAIGRGLRLG